jgi:peptidyl-Asp metalloendopeptidase
MKRVSPVGLVLLLLFAVDAAAQQMPESIFSVIDATVADRAMSSMTVAPKGVADRRVVGMHLDRLFDSSASRVLLNVDQHQWIAAFERLDRDIQGHRAWVGSIEGIDHSHVSFAERDGVVSGLINALSEVYAVHTIAPGVYTLDRVVQSGTELQPLVPESSGDVASVAAPLATANDDAAFIDVLILYTPGARGALGTQQIQARAAQIISDSNTIFSRSGVTTRLRLAGSAEVAAQETSSMSNDLSALRTNSTVQAMRDSVGADLVQLLQDSPDGNACGIGYLMNTVSNSFAPFAYSIADVSVGCVYTPTHEMGHNMGSHHDPLNASGNGAFPYSYGYQHAVSPGGFRTVMAYACSGVPCGRIANMSSASVLNNGFPTGNANQDNTRSINNTAFTIANLRQSTIGSTTVPGAPTGLTSSVSGFNVTLSWNAVTADAKWAASAATAYTLQVGTAPGVYNALTLPVGNSTSVSGSGPGGTYYWRVYGSNSAGNGAPSAEATFTLGGCAAPSAPQNFTHSVGAGRVVTLSWAAPASGAAPFSYIIDAGNGPGLSDVLIAPVGGVTSLAVQAPPGTYFVRIRAANACAASSPVSNERTIVVP